MAARCVDQQVTYDPLLTATSLGPEAPLCPGALLKSRRERPCRRWEEKQRVALCAVPGWSLVPEASGFLHDSCHSNANTPVSSESPLDRGPSVGDGSLFLWMFSVVPQCPHLVTSVISPLPPTSPLRQQWACCFSNWNS